MTRGILAQYTAATGAGTGRKLLLTGEKGYIVTCLEKWLATKQEVSRITKISLRGEAWKAADFSGYDCVVHLAGLSHGQKKWTTADYGDVNTRLTAELAQKAKLEGVRHFIFISTMAVYGVQDTLGQSAVINEETALTPQTLYGKSKLDAEKALAGLAGDGFTLAVIRPPMVYGPGCPGNYQSLRKIALSAKMIPRYENQRSMIFIDNLCELIWLVIASRGAGVFTPQNKEYVTTWEMAAAIAKHNQTRLWLSTLFNPLLRIAAGGRGALSHSLRRAFGSLVYDQGMSSHFAYQYCVCDFQESMRKTEAGALL
jgi:UDP-glucose 4-epimerase